MLRQDFFHHKCYMQYYINVLVGVIYEAVTVGPNIGRPGASKTVLYNN